MVFSSEVERAFDDHYQRTATEPDSFQSTMMRDKESTYEWEREGQETAYAIMDAAEIPETVAQDIQKVLEDRHADFDSAAAGEETEFDAEAHYEEKSSSDSDWQAEWRNFETSLKRGVSQISVVHGPLGMSAEFGPPCVRPPMILNAIVSTLKRRAQDDFKGRHYEASLIIQAVSWYLRYPLSYRDIEEMFLERGFEVDHSTLNRWVLAYAPLIERRLRSFRKPHCGSVRIDETYIRIRGEWRYLYRAVDKHGTAVDFLLTAKRDLDAAKRFFRKMLERSAAPRARSDRH